MKKIQLYTLTLYLIIVIPTVLIIILQKQTQKQDSQYIRINDENKYLTTKFLNNYDKLDNYDISMTLQTSTLRLFFFKYLLERWHGPISASVYLSENETDIHDFEMMNDQRLIISLYKSNSSIYPINLLRNLAIKKTITSHIYICDMDFWPSSNLYESFMELPMHIKQDDYLAIIVPAFEYINTTIKDIPFVPAVNSYIDKIPKTKLELKECLQTELCQRFRVKSHKHEYHYDGWIDEPLTKSVIMLQSFKFKYTEPYVIVQKSSHMPLFSELFYNYGRNKLEWIEHIRYIGYKFGLLIQGYGIDIPHPPSKFLDDWRAQAKLGIIPFADIYDKYMENLHKEIKDTSILRIENSTDLLSTPQWKSLWKEPGK